MKTFSIEKTVGIAMLVFAVGFNLFLYRLEPTATIDPNDNTFQFGLVDRTNTMWDYANRQCSSSAVGIVTYPVCHFSYLADHWVHNWAAGYNLPYYYSHVPQILIVGSWRAIHLFFPQLTLFLWYHIVIYALLCIIPLPVFFALRVMGLSWLTAGVGALLATHLSTDGLYGLDPSSFLWRGYGLSSQLFAMIWLPLAFAYSFRFFSAETLKEDAKELVRKFYGIGATILLLGQRRSNREPVTEDAGTISKQNAFRAFLVPAVFFVTATTAGHLGIGMICMLSLGFLAAGKPISEMLRQQSVRDIMGTTKSQFFRLVMVAGSAIFLLSYWILPTFIDSNFHNISFWDPVWKFDSYGAKETIIRLFNGDLFDFGRLPILTVLTLLGTVVAMKRKQEPDRDAVDLSPFSFLFIFWMAFYFGRTTWGGLIDLIPGMKDFHLSRFLVGVHASGMLLAPIGFGWLAERLYRLLKQRLPGTFSAGTALQKTATRIAVWFVVGIVLVPKIYSWTVSYNELNDRLIVQANANHAKAAADEQRLFAKLRSLPAARIFAGRGGSYGKTFRVAETPYFMDLSTYGLPTSLWLPETWSMNSDTEQFFSDNQLKDYDLYNLHWSVAPPAEPPQEFWKQIDESPSWKLYEVPTTGFFTVGVRPAIVSITKTNFVNLIHLWVQSDYHKNGLYPELTFDKRFPKPTGLPNFKMTDEVTYVTPDNKKHNLWTEPPVYLPPGTASLETYDELTDKSPKGIRLLGPEKVDDYMSFSTKVQVDPGCTECIVVLKQTAHPNWKAYVDGKPANTMIVFPFYTAIKLETAGAHDIRMAYEPSPFKTGLVFIAFLIAALSLWFANSSKRSANK